MIVAVWDKSERLRSNGPTTPWIIYAPRARAGRVARAAKTARILAKEWEERARGKSGTKTGNEGARQERAADLAPLIMQQAVGSLGHY